MACIAVVVTSDDFTNVPIHVAPARGCLSLQRFPKEQDQSHIFNFCPARPHWTRSSWSAMAPRALSSVAFVTKLFRFMGVKMAALP